MTDAPKRVRSRYETPWGPAPSVTTILNVYGEGSQQLIGWAARLAAAAASRGLPVAEAKNEHVRVRNAAGDAGTRVHDQVMRVLLGDQPDFDVAESPRERRQMEQLLSWWRASDLTPLQVEVVVCNRAPLFAGRADLYAVTGDGRRVLIDFKTSKALRSSYDLQVAAYARARLRWFGGDWVDAEPVDEAWLILIGEDRVTVRSLTVGELDICWSGFVAAATLYDFSKCQLGATKESVNENV